jgi:hypothetical protein
LTGRGRCYTDPVDPNTRYVASSLQLSGVSGWRVGALYEISFEDADWDYDWLAPASNNPEYTPPRTFQTLLSDRRHIHQPVTY